MAGSKSGSSAWKLPHINPLESLSGLARPFTEINKQTKFGQELKKQTMDQGIKAALPEALTQTGLIEKPRKSQEDMQPGQEYLLGSADKAPAKPKAEILGGIDYRREVIHGTDRIHNRQMTELDQKIQQIMVELKRLVDSSQAISSDYLQLAMDQKPVAAGTYHLNFFDFMLSVIRSARQKVEDSGAWLQVSKKKNGYQQKAQSMGTKFTLSHERNVATQSG
jgi:hypothetical protein